MKNLSPLFALMFFVSGINAQCTIDSTVLHHQGIYPYPDSLPCIERNTAYNATIQVQCPTYFDSTVNLGITSYPIQVTVDSMELDSIINLPAGITWVKNPNRLNGGQNGCLTFSGITTDPTGAYNLLWYGTVWATLPSPVPAQYAKQNYTGVLNRMPWFDYYLNVINPGDACVHTNATGISGSNMQLNSMIDIYPNPNNGVFEIRLDAGSRINGEIIVIDATGRKVYSQHLDILGAYNTSINLSSFAKGLYTFQLRTAEGFASRNISIQ